MSEVKQSLIDMILSGKEELMKMARAPFVKKTTKRALASARDSVSIEISDSQLKIQALYENITEFPNNIQKISDLMNRMEDGEKRKKNIEAMHLALFGKPMKEEEID